MIDASYCLPSDDSSLNWSSWYRGGAFRFVPNVDSCLNWSSWYRGGAFRFVPTRRLVLCRERSREMVVVDTSDSRIVSDQGDTGGRRRFILYKLSHKAIERIAVGRRHAG
jgi:hypothetical protein